MARKSDPVPETEQPTVVVEQPAEAAPPTVEVPPPVAAAPAPSVLERVRANQMGPLTAALGVALVVGLLLAILVPDRPNLYASGLLGALLTAAVGFTARYLSRDGAIWDQLGAFVATVIGVHVMFTTGSAAAVAGEGAPLLALIGLQGPGFDDALLGALALPAISSGAVLCGLAAAIITGWGPRERD